MASALYLDGTSGISGDMTVAALLDLGASETRLREALATLDVADEFAVKVSRASKSGLDACDFDVVLDAAHENHDHDMAYLYGHLHGQACAGSHGHEHEHHVDHRESDHHHGHHPHPTLANITRIVEVLGLTPRARRLALSVFGKLAEAEALAHGATPDTVHFHEVGATDSIVDICSVAICLDDLGVTDVIVEGLAEGHGTIRCAHGIMPIPVPAVANLCRLASIELVPCAVEGELVTPTGAAIVAALRTASRLPGRYRINGVGLGAGKRSYEGTPGVLRAMLVEPVAGTPDDANGLKPAELASGCEVTKLETDIDDSTGEAIGRTIELLMAAGAREAHATPVVMKKGRPGLQLEVVCDTGDITRLERIIFENTTTIGIRAVAMRRDCLARRANSVSTPFGTVRTKVVTMPDGTERAYPEYDSVTAACERTGAGFQDVFDAAVAAGAKGK